MVSPNKIEVKPSAEKEVVPQKPDEINTVKPTEENKITTPAEKPVVPQKQKDETSVHPIIDNNAKPSIEVITPVQPVSKNVVGPVIQIISIKDSVEARGTQARISKAIGRAVTIVNENGINKLLISGLTGKDESDVLIDKLAQAGFPEAQLSPENYYTNDNSFDDKYYTAVIQVGAFIGQENASDAEQALHKITDLPTEVIFEGGYYKVRISGFPSRVHAIAFLPKLYSKGFSEAYVVRVKRQ